MLCTHAYINNIHIYIYIYHVYYDMYYANNTIYHAITIHSIYTIIYLSLSIYIYMYTCVYIYIYTHIHIYIYILMFVCMYDTSLFDYCITSAVLSACGSRFSRAFVSLLFILLDLCVSSLRRGHANVLCIVPI